MKVKNKQPHNNQYKAGISSFKLDQMTCIAFKKAVKIIKRRK
uniref:Uncharacterized protein n=1 Tax=Myoviridae sp. ct2iG11 TaxID=2826605 RepID=A0A8S5QZV7_9CAUD|nr:MAG TPA: hypothetical protein [Myoviridae sp. ct2iG11]